MSLTLQVLAKIDRKKALVYKKRGLVDVISKGQGVEVLQLRFKAKGTYRSSHCIGPSAPTCSFCAHATTLSARPR